MGGVADSLTPDNVRKSSLVNILSCLLTLAGALLMWRLIKKGYYLYIAGIVIAAIGMVVIFGGIMGAVSAGGTGFVGVIMIILYGVNLKDMH
jgi:hypothetical protein